MKVHTHGDARKWTPGPPSTYELVHMRILVTRLGSSQNLWTTIWGFSQIGHGPSRTYERKKVRIIFSSRRKRPDNKSGLRKQTGDERQKRQLPQRVGNEQVSCCYSNGSAATRPMRMLSAYAGGTLTLRAEPQCETDPYEPRYKHSNYNKN